MPWQWRVADPAHNPFDFSGNLPYTCSNALRRWLEGPTDHLRWGWASAVPRAPAAFALGELGGKSIPERLDLLGDEIKAILHLLDFPYEAFAGISRDVALVMRGQRLRQIVQAVGLRRARKEIERLTQPTRPRPQEAPQPRKRRRGWLRWAVSGAI